jgi:hypothetical protein
LWGDYSGEVQAGKPWVQAARCWFSVVVSADEVQGESDGLQVWAVDHAIREDQIHEMQGETRGMALPGAAADGTELHLRDPRLRIELE